MNVRYRVELSQIERDELTAMLGGGKHAARKLKRAQILLAADAGCCDAEIVRTVRVSLSSVGRTKRRFVEGNLERALCEEPRPGAERKLTGKEEALLVATACAKPPAGRKRWTLTLLADTMVKLTDHDSLSGETVRRRLAENDLTPWRRDMWCIPHVDGEYVARMEDVLDLYAEAPASSESDRAERAQARPRPSHMGSSVVFSQNALTGSRRSRPAAARDPATGRGDDCTASSCRWDSKRLPAGAPRGGTPP